MTKLTAVIKMLTFIRPNLLQGLNDNRKRFVAGIFRDFAFSVRAKKNPSRRSISGRLTCEV